MKADVVNVSGIKLLAKTIHRIPLQRIHRIIAADPLGLPSVDAGLKAPFAPIPASIRFIPQPHLPHYFRLGSDSLAAPLAAHGIRRHFSAAPKDFPPVIHSHNLIGGLFRAAFAVPAELRLWDIDANGIFQIFRFQANRFHISSPDVPGSRPAFCQYPFPHSKTAKSPPRQPP